jgi:hypothetical protein
MQLKAYNQFINELNITSLKHLFQGNYNKDPLLKKDVETAVKIFDEDTFFGKFSHNMDDEFYVAYDSRAPKMDRVKQLMDKANSEMKKLHLEIDKTAKVNPEFYDDDDRLEQIIFFMVGTIKEKK